MSKHKPFPVPEAVIDGRCTGYLLDAGTVKYVFIDRNAGAEGKPCWLIYVPEHNIVPGEGMEHGLDRPSLGCIWSR